MQLPVSCPKRVGLPVLPGRSARYFPCEVSQAGGAQAGLPVLLLPPVQSLARLPVPPTSRKAGLPAWALLGSGLCVRKVQWKLGLLPPEGLDFLSGSSCHRRPSRAQDPEEGGTSCPCRAGVGLLVSPLCLTSRPCPRPSPTRAGVGGLRLGRGGWGAGGAGVRGRG